MTFTAVTIDNSFRRSEKIMESFDAPNGKCEWCQSQNLPVRLKETQRAVLTNGGYAICESRLTICARCAWVFGAKESTEGK